jgi:alkaline phosphatase D
LDGKSILDDFHVNRLDFLRYSLATSVAVWAGTQVSGIDEAEAQDLFGRAALDPARFPQSVASGDPKPNGIVLWTRVKSGSRETLRVGYRIALDDGRDDGAAFADPVLSGVAETSRAKDYTLKVQLQNAALKPFRKYRYRFYFNGSFSRTGCFKTLPAPDQATDKVRFGYVSCQDYTNGYFNAYHHLAQEDLDFVVHLGDYTNETVASESFQGGGPEERNDFKFPDGGDEELTLRDYRVTYKLYKRDQNLQKAHENFAFIMIWDDHEFANDAYQIYAPDEGGTQEQPNRNPRRREAASRAWFEYNPVGVYYNPDRDPLNEIVLFRSFAFGDLMELVMTDQRL